MGLAKPLGRNDVGVDPLRDQESYYCRSAPRRKDQIVGDALSLQCRPHRRVVGVTIDHHFGILQTPQLWGDVVGELRLAGLA